MNDFTKEELEQVLFFLKNHGYPPIYEKIINKIQSMIDNYCNHPERTYHRKTGKRTCPHCDTCFGDNSSDIEKRLENEHK